MERKFKITVDGHEYSVTVEELTDAGNLPYPGSLPYPEPHLSFPRPAPITAAPLPAFAQESPGPIPAAARAPADPGDVVSTLGGVVESLLVTVGQEIRAGDRVVMVEAMKMKTPITAHQAGKVAAILVNVGDGVQTGQPLVRLS